MSEKALVPQPFLYNDRSEMRQLFKQYLQTEE